MEGTGSNIVIRRIPLAAAAALATALLADPGSAQTIRSPYDFVETSQGIHVFAAYVATDRGTINVGPGSGTGFGVGYTFRISGPFNLDARLTYLPTDRRVFDLTAADSADIREDPTVGLVELGTAGISLALLDASLRFDITGPRTWHNLQPYALIGAGGVFRVSTDNEIEQRLPSDIDLRVRFSNGVTGHVGAGVEWHLGDHFGFRAEARDVLWNVDIPGGFFVPGRVIDDSEWVQTAHLSLGLSYRF